MIETGWPGEAAWSPPLRAAMDRVSDTMRTFADSEVSALRAALSIALADLAEAGGAAAHPEVVVQYAEETIDFSETWPSGHVVPHRVGPGEVYLVCPVCCGSGEFVFFDEGVEFSAVRRLRMVEDQYGDRSMVAAGRSDFDFTSDGDFGVSHQSYDCFARLSLPVWFDLD